MKKLLTAILDLWGKFKMAITGNELIEVRGQSPEGVPAATTFNTTAQDIANLANGDPTDLGGNETLEVLKPLADGEPAAAPFTTTTGAIAALADDQPTVLTGDEIVVAYEVNAIGGISAYPTTATVQDIADLAGDQPISPDIEDNVSGLDYFWDAKGGYSSGQTWANQIAAPSDGSAQTDSDVFLGADGNPGANDPVFEDNHWTFDGAQFFTAAHANPTQIANMHKGTSSWTWFAKLQTPAASAVLNTLFATASVAGNTGIVIRGDSGARFKVDQYSGGVIHTQQISGAFAASNTYNIAVAYDHLTDTLKMAVDSSTWTEFSPSGWVPTATAATNGFHICANGVGGTRVTSGTLLYGMFMCDHAMTGTELAQAINWADSYYFPLNPELPSAPTRFVIQGGDEVVSLAWVNVSDGGATITDNVVQYREVGEVSWETFAHDASGYPGITVTGLTNDQEYEFRVASTNILGTGSYSAIVTGTPGAFTIGPYDLTPYKITIPVDLNGFRSGLSAEIDQPEFLTYESAWFGKIDDGGDGTYVFNCPNGGATTSSRAVYTRSELRDLTNYDVGDAQDDTVNFAVTTIPNAMKVVVHQIHGFGDDDDPWVKMNYTGRDNGTGTLRAQIQPTPDPASLVNLTVKTGLANGETTICKIEYTGDAGGNLLQIYIDGALTPAIVTAQTGNMAVNYVGLPCSVPMSRTGQWYFKRGNYFQNRDDNGLLCTVVHYPLP